MVFSELTTKMSWSIFSCTVHHRALHYGGAATTCWRVFPAWHSQHFSPQSPVGRTSMSWCDNEFARKDSQAPLLSRIDKSPIICISLQPVHEFTSSSGERISQKIWQVSDAIYCALFIAIALLAVLWMPNNTHVAKADNGDGESIPLILITLTIAK